MLCPILKSVGIVLESNLTDMYIFYICTCMRSFFASFVLSLSILVSLLFESPILSSHIYLGQSFFLSLSLLRPWEPLRFSYSFFLMYYIIVKEDALHHLLCSRLTQEFEYIRTRIISLSFLSLSPLCLSLSSLCLFLSLDV